MRVSIYLLVLILLATTTFAEAPFVPGQVIVRFNESTSLKDAESYLDSGLFSVVNPLVPPLDIYLVKLLPTISVEEALKILRTSPKIIWAQADHLLESRTITPNDNQFASEWNLSQTSNCDIDAVEAWDYTTGGTTVGGDPIVVAVVDGGCQLNHVDLAANIWTNSHEIPGNGIDDDNNGYIDDIHGWNAYSNTGSIPVDAHGTHVSGIIGARGNNLRMICGINWNVKLMEVAARSGQTSTVAAGYNYILTQKNLWWSSGGTAGANIVVTNNSFGVDSVSCMSGTYPIWNDLYNAMGQTGILSAVATTNQEFNVDVTGDIPSGCSSDYIIAVTNTTKTDLKKNPAGYGAINVDLGAPGTEILSTLPTDTTGLRSGTSMATPHVAGAVAFLHAAANSVFNNYYISNHAAAALVMKQIILANVDTLSSLERITVSGGRLSLFKAAHAIRHYGGPANDECPGFEISSLPYNYNGTTAAAVHDYATCVSSLSPDVVFNLALACSTTVTVSLCGSGFNTAVEVRSGGACPGINLVACNDNSVLCPDGNRSTVSFEASVGTKYYILVHGAGNESGDYVLNVTGMTRAGVNDECPGTHVTGLPFTDSGSTMCAYSNYNSKCVGATSPDMFYTLTLPSCQRVTASLCGSEFDTGLEVRTGGSCPGNTLVACNNDYCGSQSQVEFLAYADSSYYLIVQGAGNSSGVYRITITGVPETAITAPNGGEVWLVGESHNITWSPSGLSEPVTIELMRNYPSGSWETLFSSTPDDGIEPWMVTGPVSTSARLRITGVTHTSVADTSDANFTIDQRQLTLTTPNGGESWTVDSTLQIVWTSAHVTGNVKIELTRDYPFGTWETLIAETANSGSFPWKVTEPLTTATRVRITSVDFPTLGDTSNMDFSITVTNRAPVIAHDPLHDQTTATFPVTALITDDAEGFVVHFCYKQAGAMMYDSLLMTATATPDEYAVTVGPLTDGSYDYFVQVRDAGGAVASTTPFTFISATGYGTGSVQVYDDETAERSNWSQTNGYKWAVKFSTTDTPYLLYLAQIGISATRPSTAHSPIDVQVVRADGIGGLPGTVIQSRLAGSIGNVIGGLSYPPVNWSTVLFRDNSGLPLRINGDFYIVVSNPDTLHYESFLQDTSSDYAGRSYVYNPCREQWFAESSGDTCARLGNRMIRVMGYSLTPPMIVHDPLHDQTAATFPVTAMITNDAAGFIPRFFYKRAGAMSYDSLLMTATSHPGEYAVTVGPIANGCYDYFLRVQDADGLISATAPFTFFAEASNSYGLAQSYDDGTAELSNWTGAVGFKWAVKFSTAGSPYLLYLAQIGISATHPNTAHSPIQVQVLLADSVTGLPGPVIKSRLAGSIGNIIGGPVSPPANWCDVVFQDTAGSPLQINGDFFIAVSNPDSNYYESFLMDTSSVHAGHSYVFDSCDEQWFAESSGYSNSRAGNRMIRAKGFSLKPPNIVIQRSGDNIILNWTTTGAPLYTIYSATTSDGPFTTVEGTSTGVSFVDAGAVSAGLKLYYQVKTTVP